MDIMLRSANAANISYKAAALLRQRLGPVFPGSQASYPLQEGDAYLVGIFHVMLLKQSGMPRSNFLRPATMFCIKHNSTCHLP
jgi:hypothetical protein